MMTNWKIPSELTIFNFEPPREQTKRKNRRAEALLDFNLEKFSNSKNGWNENIVNGQNFNR